MTAGMRLQRAILLAIVGFLTVAGAGCSKQVSPKIVIQLPPNFTGQIHVEMGVAGAPTLPREGGNYVIHVPGDGKVLTSTVIVDGEAKIDVPADRVWGYGKSLTKTGDGVPVGGNIEFFVGTQEQYKTSEAHKNKSHMTPTNNGETPDHYAGS